MVIIMKNVNIDFGKNVAELKLMNAVNNGPAYSRNGDQYRSNLEEYKQARIPYARTHDAAFYNGYGGEHIVDVHMIFPDFDKDPDDESAYDFQLTDEYLKDMFKAGTKPYYRLGSKIEHWSKKYGTIPPKDFKKWAVICEHIIKHYNCGWANGFHMDIEYWEIWNEPENVRTCWIGTYEKFYEFFKIALTHLKEKFPELKFGGSGFDPHDYNDEYMKNLMDYLTEGERAPLDFMSWHDYTNNPKEFGDCAVKMRELLDKYGYTETETHLNEWNYVRGWREDFVYSIQQIIGFKGAAFSAATIEVCQNAPVDMLMYYDARPCVFNGLFDFYSLKPIKGYWPFYVFADMLELKNQTYSGTDDEDIYVLAASDGKKDIAMITYFSEDDEAEPKEIEVSMDNASKKKYDIYVIDETHTYEKAEEAGSKFKITLKPNTVIAVR